MSKNYSKMIEEECKELGYTDTECLLRIVAKALGFCADELKGIRTELQYISSGMWAAKYE